MTVAAWRESAIRVSEVYTRLTPKEKCTEPFLLSIDAADEVTVACCEDHEKGENDEVKEDAAHDVCGVSGGEVGELV